MKNDRGLRAAEEWARRDPPGPHAIRDAWLGWIGSAVVAALVWALFAG